MSNAHVGTDIDVNELRTQNDAVVICTGATWPRDLKIPGREGNGVHFAMEYLQVSVYNILRIRQSRLKTSADEHQVAP